MFNDSTISGPAGIGNYDQEVAANQRLADSAQGMHCDPEAGLRGGQTVGTQVTILVCAYSAVFWLLLSGQV